VTDWQFIRSEYRIARLHHGWLKALRMALKANKTANETIPF
jgi:hypothetical protein